MVNVLFLEDIIQVLILVFIQILPEMFDPVAETWTNLPTGCSAEGISWGGIVIA